MTREALDVRTERTNNPERRPARLFAVALVAALLTTIEACGGYRLPTPAAPTESPPDVPPKPSGPTNTISGVVTEYRRGPLSGVNVRVRECHASWGIPCVTQTDQQGQYSISTPSMDPTTLGVGKPGYQAAWKRRVSAQDSIANFTLHRSEIPLARGWTLAETIWGDEFIAGDDVLFGGLCAHTPCKVMEITNLGPLDPAEIRLRWNDPTRRLALYKFTGDPDGFPLFDQPGDRYSGPSELVATVSISGYFDAIAVAFEQAASGPPGPSDSEQFQLTVRSVP